MSNIDLNSLDLQYANDGDRDFIIDTLIKVSDGIYEILLKDLISGMDMQSLMNLFINNENDLYKNENFVLIKALSNNEERNIALLYSYDVKHHKLPFFVKKIISNKRLKAIENIFNHNISNSLYINTLYVDTDVRGLNVASLLLDVAKEKAYSLNLKAISLHCFKDNEIALSFYKKEGFQIAFDISYEGLLKDKHKDGGYILSLEL